VLLVIFWLVVFGAIIVGLNIMGNKHMTKRLYDREVKYVMETDGRKQLHADIRKQLYGNKKTNARKP
jgi:hypothetical protein